MQLLELRTLAAKKSGRYDLVTSTFADNGMNFFINAACTMLDSLSETPKETSRIFDKVAAGVWYMDILRCREIHDVWINNSEGRSQLTKKEYIELIADYPGLISATDQGTPLYYTPNYLRTQDATDIDTLGAFFNHVITGDSAYRGIIILPPPDEEVVIEIMGLFYSKTLALETDDNYWSINFPDILLMATLYKIEVFNRNSEGMRDWMLAITTEIDLIRKDLISEETYDMNQIEG